MIGFTEEQKQIIKEEYLKGTNTTDIAIILGESKYKLFHYIQRSCDFYKPIEIKFNDSDFIDILTKYKTGLTIKQISEIYNVKWFRIRGIIKRSGIIMRDDYKKSATKYTINEKYFEKIDTNNKAYTVGLLFSDGSNNSKRGHIQINLQEGDKNILDKINLDMESNRPFGFIKKQKEHHQNQLRLSVRNKKISKDLSDLGCIKNKSLLLEYPNLEEDKHSHFIRGYFDGDGSFCFYNKTSGEQAGIQIVSSSIFINKLKEIVLTYIGIKSSIYICKNNKTSYLCISGGINCMKFLNWIYKDANIYMDRKYNKYLSFIEYRKERGLPI